MRRRWLLFREGLRQAARARARRRALQAERRALAAAQEAPATWARRRGTIDSADIVRVFRFRAREGSR